MHDTILLGVFIILVTSSTMTENIDSPSNTTGGNNPSTAVTSSPIKRKTTQWQIPRTPTTALFKSAMPELDGKVFITGPSQAARYDEVYRVLVNYFCSEFSHRIFHAFEAKDQSVGFTIITKPTPPKVKEIVQVASAETGSTLTGVEKEVIDKDSE